ncbi:hypothetical protein H112_05345 [Trichophyton rubrum D6]|nr:hypothetical protein H104_05344 [Trichophyton rubrum CBS 289.86]EZG04944.1 hypothetical protein H106_05193 [Trichophyton rubrum CBS 735.88]EZG15521.1 hypothetical protein H107_05485 [Trichophyton rubrum CBS 202.88]KDB32472.1 hypothetical protein H112_05345 [Trichophyton rubrum D6]
MAGHAGAGLTLARWPPMPRWQTMDPHESITECSIGEEEGGDGTAENATLHTEYHDRKSVRMDEIRMIGCYRLLASLPAKTGGVS